MASTSSASVQYDSDIFTNYVPDPKNPTGNPQVIQSYTISLQVFDASFVPMANGSLLIQASSPTIVSLNGQTVMLSVQPFRYALDFSGDFGLIIPSTGLGSPSYTFSFLQDQNGHAVDMPVLTIDPSRKALAVFENIKTGAQLKTTLGRSGTTLYSMTSPAPDADLDAAAKAFQDLSAAAKNMPVTPASVQSALDNLKKSPLPNNGWPSNAIKLPANALADPQSAIQSVATQEAQMVADKTKQLEQNLLHFAGHSPATAQAHQQVTAQPTAANETVQPDPKAVTRQTHQVKLSIGGFFNKVGDGLKDGANDVKDGFDDGAHGAESLADSLKKDAGTWQKDAEGVEHQVMQPNEPAGWIFDHSKQSWSYLVKAAGKVWSIVVQHMEDVGKVFEKIWGAIKLGWEEFEAWVGYLFDWRAIIAMQKDIQSSMNDFLNDLVADVKGDRKKFNALVGTLTTLAKAKLDPPNDNTKASDVTTQAAPGLKSNQSAPDKWFNHHVKHGGLTDVQQVDTVDGEDSSNDTPPSDKLTSTMGQIEPLLRKLGQDLANDVGARGDFSISQAAAHLTDTVFGAVADALTLVVDEFLDLIADLIEFLKKVMNGRQVASILEPQETVFRDSNSHESSLTAPRIKVPILSWLYREITGEELTFFSFASLCAAIIASVSYQAFTSARRRNMVVKAAPRTGAQTVQPEALKSVVRQASKNQNPSPTGNQDSGNTNNTNNTNDNQQNESSSSYKAACAAFGGAVLKGVVAAASAGLRSLVVKQTDKAAGIPALLAVAKIILAASMTVSNKQSTGLPAMNLRESIPILMALSGLINAGIALGRYCKDPRKLMGRKSARLYHVVDMASATCYFGISSAVFVAERDAKDWSGRDIAQSRAQEVANAFNWAYEMDGAIADMVWDEGDSVTHGAENENELAGQILDGVSVVFAVGNVAALGGKMWIAGEHDGTDFTITGI